MITAPPITDYLARGQVARELHLSPERISQMAQTGQIDFVETALGRLYPRSEVERIRRERTKAVPDDR